MAKKPSQKLVLSYQFFVEKERNGQSFTIEDLCAATGWKEDTPKTYMGKKWKPFLIPDDGKLIVSGIQRMSETEYLRYMSQTKDVSEPDDPNLHPIAKELLLKSRQAAIHALDGYNRPYTEFRTEGFTVMMVIAWRCLFHAIFERDSRGYVYTDKDGKTRLIDGEPKTWELSQCIKEYFADNQTPVRSNLDFIVGLRNKIEHRYVPELDVKVAGECQALILNYDSLLVEQFGSQYALRDSLVFPLQTSVIRPQDHTEVLKRLQANHFKDIIEYIDAFRRDVGEHIYHDMAYSFRVYLVPKVASQEGSADLSIEFVKADPDNPLYNNIQKQLVALVKEKVRPVVNAGRLKPSQVVKKVAAQLKVSFNTSQHTKAWKMYSVRATGKSEIGCDPRYCHFDEVHEDYVHTEEWVDFLVSKLSDEKEYHKLMSFKPTK